MYTSCLRLYDVDVYYMYRVSYGNCNSSSNKLGHISRNCPGPPECPPLPRTNDRSNNRNNQRGRGGGYGNGGYRNGGNRNNQYNSGHGGRNSAPETQTAAMTENGVRNWAAAAQERVQFTPEETVREGDADAAGLRRDGR